MSTFKAAIYDVSLGKGLDGTMRRSLRLDLVCADGGTQIREAVSPTTVSEYAEALRAGAKFPPIDVFFDGSRYWPADGFHRLEAHCQAGLQEIDAELHNGSRRDALLYAAGANAEHGLRRTSEDKKRAVLTLLRDPEWREWSDREIAGRVKVDHKTVGKYRRELNGEFPIETERRFRTRQGTEARRTVVANGPSVKRSSSSATPFEKNGDAVPGSDEFQADAEVACPPNPAPVMQGEAGAKRQHAPASDARAAEKQIEEALSRLAALPPSERAVVIEVAVDRWGLARSEEPAAEDDDIPSSHTLCLDLAALKSGWTDVIVAMAITRVIGTALYAPDAPKIPAPDQTRQLIETLEQWLDRLQGPVDAQPGCNSAITVGTVGDGYYTSDPAQSAGSEQPRVVALEGGEAIIVWHSAGSRTSKQPVRKWKVSPPHPEAQYPVSVSVYFVEPRKRRGKCTNVDPDNRKYLTVELADGTVLYDSRAEVPYDATNRWPSREEWAKDRRTYYGDDQNPASRRLSEYASPAEVEVIIGALKQSYHDLGRCLAEAKAAVGAACQQPAETNKQYSARWALMSDPEQSLMKKVYDAKDQRRVINRALKLIARDELPFLRDEGGTRFEIAVATARYEAACRAAEQALRDEVAQQPIDDAAWEEQLQWRAWIERRNPLEVE
jgi:hypothetical protein